MQSCGSKRTSPSHWQGKHPRSSVFIQQAERGAGVLSCCAKKLMHRVIVWVCQNNISFYMDGAEPAFEHMHPVIWQLSKNMNCFSRKIFIEFFRFFREKLAHSNSTPPAAIEKPFRGLYRFIMLLVHFRAFKGIRRRTQIQNCSVQTYLRNVLTVHSYLAKRLYHFRKRLFGVAELWLVLIWVKTILTTFVVALQRIAMRFVLVYTPVVNS